MSIRIILTFLRQVMSSLIFLQLLDRLPQPAVLLRREHFTSTRSSMMVFPILVLCNRLVRQSAPNEFSARRVNGIVYRYQ